MFHILQTSNQYQIAYRIHRSQQTLCQRKARYKRTLQNPVY